MVDLEKEKKKYGNSHCSQTTKLASWCGNVRVCTCVCVCVCALKPVLGSQDDNLTLNHLYVFCFYTECNQIFPVPAAVDGFGCVSVCVRYTSLCADLYV